MSNSDPGNRDAALSRFERRVLELMVDGDSAEALILQEQVAVAEVTGRASGAVWLDVPGYAPRLSPPHRLAISNLSGVVVGRDGREQGVCFTLHIDDGAISMLEMPGGGVPEPPQLKSWSYNERGRHGLILPRAWSP